MSLPKSLQRTRSALEALRLRPHDTSTEAGRSQERFRRAGHTAITSVAAKLTATAGTLITVPLTLHYLGPERYGLWLALSSVLALMAFADLGMGNGVLNAVARSHGEGNQDLAVRTVSSAFYLLSAVAVLLCVAAIAVSPRVPWGNLLNITSAVAVREAGPAFTTLVVCTALNMPLGIVQRTKMGFQEGAAFCLWQIGGSVLSLGAILVAVAVRAGLPALVFAAAGVPTIVMAVCFSVEFFARRRWLRPRLAYADWRRCAEIAKVGLVFVVLQVAGAAMIASDNIIIAHQYGAAAVPPYGIAYKIFAAAMIYQYVGPALWPAFGEAWHAGITRGRARPSIEARPGTSSLAAP